MKRLVLISAVLLPPMAYGQDEPAQNEAEIREMEEVVVRGRFVESLADGLAQKRKASEIIEALSAEDIGELPDTSIAESLARLPGLAATRDVFGAGAISIRGLGSSLTNSTLNGRDLAAEFGDRTVALNLFPAELISGAGVYKAPAASQVEGGIAGAIDLRTVRPLDHDGRERVLNFRTRFNDLAGNLPNGEEFGYRGSATFIDQFADNTVGVALGYAGQFQPFVSAESSIFNSRTVNFGANIAGLPKGFGKNNALNIPSGADFGITDGASERHSFLGALQFRPAASFELNLDGFYSALDQGNRVAGVQTRGFGSFGNVFSNVDARDFNIVSATAACNVAAVGSLNACIDRGFGQSLKGVSALDEADSTLQSYGLEGKWSAGAWTLTADFSYSRAEGNNRFRAVHYRPYNTINGVNSPVRPVSSFGENAAGAAFLSSPLDFTDLARNRIDALRIVDDDTRIDEIFSYRFDAEYALDGDLFTAFRAGARIVNRDNTLINRSGGINLFGGTDRTVAIDRSLFIDTFHQGDAHSAFAGLNSVLLLDTQRILDTVFAGVKAQAQPSGSHLIEENIQAGYAQLDFDSPSIFGIPAGGNLGLRVVSTAVDTQGTNSVNGVASAVNTADRYTEILPSLNINFFPTEDIIVRLAASRAMSRPNLNFLSPGTDRSGRTAYGGAGGGGNPFLRPFIANQADVTFEKYFSAVSAITFAAFYKDIETYITQTEVTRGPRKVLFFIPANGQGGRIYGFEVFAQHTFTGLLPEGAGDIGIYANYSWTDSNIKLRANFNSGVFGLDGQSDHVFNVVGFYEHKGFNARVGYRYRSAFTRNIRQGVAFSTNRGEGDLSFQISHDYNEQLRFVLQGFNLLNEPRDNFYGFKPLQGQYRVFGRGIEAGVTYRF